MAPPLSPCSPAATALISCVVLPNANLSMPIMMYGTYGASLGWGNYHPLAKKGVLDWLKMGGRGIDTAQLYEDQVEVGEAIRESGIPREEIFLQTKCSGAIGYYATVECLQQNLVMLKTSYVDSLLIHFPSVPTPECMLKGCNDRSPATPEQMLDSWRAMELIYASGRARSIGLSDYSLSQLKLTVEAAKVPPAVLQTFFNPLLHDEPLLSYCKARGIQLQAFGIFGGLRDSYIDVLGNQVIQEIARAAPRTMTSADVAVAWTVQRGVAMAIGTTSTKHMASDVTALQFTLQQEDVDQISQIYPGYTAALAEEENGRGGPLGDPTLPLVAVIAMLAVAMVALLAGARRAVLDGVRGGGVGCQRVL